jgi:hypothetical protein
VKTVPVKVFNSVAVGEAEATLRAMQAELATLREENAQLRLFRLRQQAQPGSLQGLQELRNVGGDPTGERPNDPDKNDHAWQVLTQTAVVRDLLLEMCHEVSSLSTRLARQLEALTLWDSQAAEAGSATAGTAEVTECA